MFPKKFRPGEAGPHPARQRMADIGGRKAVAAEKLLFEGKDTEQVAEGAAHTGQSALAPGPHLGGHQVYDGDALAVQLAG